MSMTPQEIVSELDHHIVGQNAAKRAVAIALRTGVVKDGILYAQAGGGVVADSEPEAEWQETQNKVRALLRAAEIAEAGLDSKIT